MAPRANWKGFLRLSLVTCPVALYPATSESEKVSFSQLNRKTGHRIKYAKVDADTREEVANEDIVKGYSLMSFGDGPHRCPGAAAALQETAIFLDRLLRVPNVHISRPPTVGWNPLISSYELRGAVIAT
jgi:hypothetical protein